MSGASRILSATDGMWRVDLNFAGVGFDLVYNIFVATSPVHQNKKIRFGLHFLMKEVLMGHLQYLCHNFKQRHIAFVNGYQKNINGYGHGYGK